MGRLPAEAAARREPPLLVVVTGPPASGKTTLAKPLAAELGFPLVSRDELKETLFDSLGPPGDIETNRKLGRASFELLHLIAARLLEAGSPVLLEANFFRGHSEGAFERLPQHRLVQVHCAVPADVVRERYAGRARHPGHLDAVRADEVEARLRAGAHDPLDLPGCVITVDTSHAVEVHELAQRVRATA